MTRGRADWAERSQISKLGGVVDLGEHAARVGGLQSQDRRGKTFFRENFTSGLTNYVMAGGGAGSSIRLTNNHSLTEGISVEMITGTDGAQDAELTRYLWLPYLSKLGIEIFFMVSSLAGYLDFSIYFNATANGIDVKVRIDFDNNKIQVFDENSAWVDVLSGAIYKPRALTWANIKLVVDPVNLLYSNLIYKGIETDISSIIPDSGGLPDQEWLNYDILYSANAAANYTVWVDSIILTQNEA